MTNSTEQVHINDIQVGDVIQFHGKMATVCRNDIKYDPFMGRSIFGDTFCLGLTPVTRYKLGVKRCT